MFLDHFSNGTVDLLQRAGLGTITEPAGSQLRLYVPSSVNCDITLGRCPVAYKGAGIVSPHRVNGPWCFDLKVDQLTNSNNNFVCGLLAWKGPLDDMHNLPYAYEIGYYGGESSIIVSRYPGSWASSARVVTSAQTKPNGTTKHIYRIIINPLGRAVRLTDLGFGEGADSYINPNSIYFGFSANGGATWTQWAQETLSFQIDFVGPFIRNWSTTSGHTHEALLDYFAISAYDWDSRKRVYVPSSPKMPVTDPASSDPQTLVGIRDEVGLMLGGGGGQQDLVIPTQDRGAFIPGPIGSPGEYGRSQPPATSFEDKFRFLTMPGDDTAAVLPGSRQRMDYGGSPAAQGAEDKAELLNQSRLDNEFFSLPELKGPFLFPRRPEGAGAQVMGAEDSLLWELGGADYQDDKLDGDGKETLYSVYNVEAVKFVDNTLGTFGNPATGHYGAAKDGKFYFNGLECSAAAPTFGTVAGGPNRRTWPWWSGSEPFGRDLPAGSSFTIPSDGAIRFVGTNLNNEAGALVSSRNGWYFSGDFDVQIDYSGLVKSGGSDGGLMLAALRDPDYLLYVRRQSGSIYDKNVHVGASGVSYASVATADTSGKLRITRTGTTLRAYYWTGAAWAQIGGDYSNSVFAGKMYILVSMWGSGNLNLDVTVSNFTINSGTWGNRAEWYDEASGTHRGTKQAMPDKMAVVATQQSVDLIDTDTDRLWMRFVKNTSNALHNFSAYSQYVRDMAWSNGTLVLAHGSSPSASEEGGTIIIDFTTELIRTTREAASTICGAVYATYTNRGWNHPPALWGIAARNNNSTYVVDWDNWQVPDYRVYSVSLLHSGIVEYLASGTLLGLAIHKVNRWYAGQTARNYNWPKRSVSSITSEIKCCRFRSDGVIFYATSTNLYSRDRTNGSNTGWEDVMDAGTFVPEKTEVLPGTRSRRSQYQPLFYGNYVFLAAHEGVYRIDWTSGSWELFYGVGGTHDILQSYVSVPAISLANDGVQDLLVVSLEGTADTRINVVKLADNSLYGVTIPVNSINTALAVAS